MQRRGQRYKVELLTLLKDKGSTAVAKETGDESVVDGAGAATVSFYKTGEFVDLCRGPHVSVTTEIGAFKLTNVAGAYWRGDEKSAAPARLRSGFFPTQDELERHIQMLEEAKRRDHRRLGQELDLFTFSISSVRVYRCLRPAEPFVRRLLEDFVQSLQEPLGYRRVQIPHITKTTCTRPQGHWEKFHEDLFHVRGKSGEEFCIKPMNCPHHTQIFACRQRSYRDLPPRFRSHQRLSRRAAGRTARPVAGADDYPGRRARFLYARTGAGRSAAHLSHHRLVLSRLWHEAVDPAVAVGRRASGKSTLAAKRWGQRARSAASGSAHAERDLGGRSRRGCVLRAENRLYGQRCARSGVAACDDPARLQPAEPLRPRAHRGRWAAQASGDAASRRARVGRAVYVRAHRTLRGAFPTWLSPLQAVVVPIADRHNEYAQQVVEKLSQVPLKNGLGTGIRAEVDDSRESMQKKIRNAQLQKFRTCWSSVIASKSRRSGGSVAFGRRPQSDAAFGHHRSSYHRDRNPHRPAVVSAPHLPFPCKPSPAHFSSANLRGYRHHDSNWYDIYRGAKASSRMLFLRLAPYELSLLVTLACLMLVWQRRRFPGARMFLAALACELAYTIGYIGELLATTVPGKTFWDNVQWLPCLAGCCFWHCSRARVRPEKPLPAWLFAPALACVPVAVATLAYSNDWHHYVGSGHRIIPGWPVPALTYEFGPVAWVAMPYLIGLALQSVTTLFFFHAEAAWVFRRQALGILIGFLVPTLAYMATLFGLNVYGYRDVTPQALAFSNVFILWSLLRYRALQLLPFAREQVFDQIQGGVLVLDTSRQVVDANAAMASLFADSSAETAR